MGTIQEIRKQITDGVSISYVCIVAHEFVVAQLVEALYITQSGLGLTVRPKIVG